jgi:hypothetical protein
MRSRQAVTSLLDADPEMGRLLSGERAARAHAELRVHVGALARGPWDVERLSRVDAGHLGLLVVDGVIAREVLLADTIGTELLGEGDLVCPWFEGNGAGLLELEVRWTVLAEARIAVLDRGLAARLARFPEVNSVLVERVLARAHRIAVGQAISQLNGVDRRLLALFWHLAPRWGRVTPDGVAVPLALSHRLLAQLVGARRPTVSAALGELGERGELVHREDGTWLLKGAPVGVPRPEVERVIAHRRRLVPSQPANGRGARRAANGEHPRRDARALRVAAEQAREESWSRARELVKARERAVELCRAAERLRVRLKLN